MSVNSIRPNRVEGLLPLKCALVYPAGKKVALGPARNISISQLYVEFSTHNGHKVLCTRSIDIQEPIELVQEFDSRVYVHDEEEQV